MNATAPALSAACTGWATTARYDVAVENGATVLRPQDRDRGTYQIRWRGTGGRVELIEIEPDDDVEQEILFAANTGVLECYLFGVLADEIRDDLELGFIDLPWRASDLNRNYTLSGMRNGYRTLARTDGSPVAAARDEAISLVKLVPLSHFLTFDLATLKRAFLHPECVPLLVNGQYSD